MAWDAEQKLFEKLRRIEALFAGAKTPGEREAAGEARQRILARLAAAGPIDPPVDFSFRIEDAWSRRLFYALLRRYRLQPYRRKGQRRTTVRTRVPKSFVDQTLWPEFCHLSETLRQHLDEVTDRILREVFEADPTEPKEEGRDAGTAAGEARPGEHGPGAAEPGHRDDIPGAAAVRGQARSDGPPGTPPPGPAAGPGSTKVGRNSPCPCGSGKKFKRCCGP